MSFIIIIFIKKKTVYFLPLSLHIHLCFTSSIVINFRESRLPIHLNQTNHQIQHIQL